MVGICGRSGPEPERELLMACGIVELRCELVLQRETGGAGIEAPRRLVVVVDMRWESCLRVPCELPLVLSPYQFPVEPRLRWVASRVFGTQPDFPPSRDRRIP